MLREVSYEIAPRGLAESFTESETPPTFALRFRNRFINAIGGAEKRRGIQQLGTTVPGTPSLTGMHELVEPDGTQTLFVSGNGNIYKFDGTSYSAVFTGWDATARIRSVQMDDKLIFNNGVNRPQFTKDGTTFEELKAIIDRGTAGTGTDSDSLHDADVDSWIIESAVAVNDLLYNRTKNAYAVVNAVATASVGHTAIGVGVASAIGVSTAAQASGDRYELIDLVELNIIPTDGEDDNTATAGAGTTTNAIVVSAVSDWTKTEIRSGDYVRNSTRAAVARVSAIATASLTVTGVSGQTSGDSLIFLKPAMPIATNAHVHFGRLYLIDERDQTKIRISGPDNPEDFTTTAGTLDATTFKFGNNQPQGDVALAMGSFQRFFGIAGRKNLYLFEGTDPIADTSAATISFGIIGLFPQGVVSNDSLVSIGNDMVFASSDGVQSLSLVNDASTLGRANLSEQLKTTLRDLFASTSGERILLLHYPRRSWLILRVNSHMYVFNYTAYLGKQNTNAITMGRLASEAGSWSLFDGKFARLNDYLVRSDGTLVCCGDSGKVYQFDVDGVYDDDGEVFTTEYQTAWLTGDEPKRRVKRKQGHYIKPIISAGGNVPYTIRAEGGFASEAVETLTFNASGGSTPVGLAVIGQAIVGGSSIQNRKYPMRWRGEQVRFTFSTEDSIGPDTLSRFTLYATVWGQT